MSERCPRCGEEMRPGDDICRDCEEELEPEMYTRLGCSAESCPQCCLDDAARDALGETDG